MCSLISTVLIHVQLRCVQCSNNTKHNILCTEESIIGVVSEKGMNTKIIMLFLSSPPVFSDVRVAQSLVLCVMFCRSLFALLYFFL
jgi:hypothetical protein